MATRSATAAIARAGEVDDVITVASLDMIDTFPGLRCRAEDWTSDITDPLLDVRLRGDLQLAAESLRPSSTALFMAALTHLGELVPAHAPARRQVVGHCRTLLTK